MTTTTVASPAAAEVLERFLGGYWSTRTRGNYQFILTGWLASCHDHHHDPIAGVDATTLEIWIAGLKSAGYAPNTLAGRVSAVSALYRWCVAATRYT